MDAQAQDPENGKADRIVRALALGGGLRVVSVTTSATSRDIGRRHRARGAQSVALARSVSAGLLLATLTKSDRETVTLQVISKGTLGGVTVDATSAGRVRAYLRRADLHIPVPTDRRTPLAPLNGIDGSINVVRDVGLRENFSGHTPLVSGEIDEDIEHYLIASEQINSVLVCDAVLDKDGTIRRAAGLLIQAMPDSEHTSLLEDFRDRLHQGILFQAMSGPRELDATALILATCPELAPDLKVLDERSVFFGCPCSRERAESTLSMLGSREIASLLAEPGTAEVVCEFCQTRYHFSSENLEGLHARLEAEAGVLPS